MPYELTGKLVAKFDTVQRNETFKTREFVVETTDDINGRVFTNYVKFQCVQDKTNMVDRFNVGDEVKVHFNIKGSRWQKEGREGYITNLDAWRIENVRLGQNAATSAEPTYTDAPADDNVNDLPF